MTPREVDEVEELQLVFIREHFPPSEAQILTGSLIWSEAPEFQDLGFFP